MSKSGKGLKIAKKTSGKRQSNKSHAVPPTPIRLLEMASGFYLTHGLYVAAELGIADLLKSGPRSPADLAVATSANPDALRRLLRALASVGIFAEDAKGRFGLTPLAEPLRSDAPGSMRSVITMGGLEWHWRAWGNLMHSIKTGKPAFEDAFGVGIFDYFGKNPEVARVFNDAMTDFSASDVPTVLEAYDFRSIRKIVDVAGGHGSLLSAILKANPKMMGVLYDLPAVADGARKRFETDGVAGRVKIVSGDFFDSIPAGVDACILKHIIHDWDDERCLKILRNCHQALPAGGKLLVVDAVIPPGNGPHMAKFLDLQMLVMTGGGRERTEEEFRGMFAKCGFKMTRMVPTRSMVCVIEGVKV